MTARGNSFLMLAAQSPPRRTFSSFQFVYGFESLTRNKKMDHAAVRCLCVFPWLQILPEKQIVYHKLFFTEMIGVAEIHQKGRGAIR